MTRKMDFTKKWNELMIQLQKNEDGMYDVELMEELGFTPPSWKVWKPQFVLKANTTEWHTGDPTKDDYKEWKIMYYKRKKHWKRIPLKKKSELDNSSMYRPYNQYQTI